MATYGVDLDAPPSSSPDSTVEVPQLMVEDEERCLKCLEDIDPLSPVCDEDHGIGCYVNCIYVNIFVQLLVYIHNSCIYCVPIIIAFVMDNDAIPNVQPKGEVCS